MFRLRPAPPDALTRRAIYALAVSRTLSAPARGAPEPGKEFKDWVVACEEREEAPVPHCYITQNIALRESGQRLLHVAVGYPPQSERPAAVSTWSVLVGDEQLRHRLQDARPVGLGGLVRHHGYVLSRSGSGALIAWPEASRPNANPAYRWTPENGVEELQSSPWSGMPTEGAPLLPAPGEQAWQPSAVASETPR